jgi:hypothetical protein
MVNSKKIERDILAWGEAHRALPKSKTWPRTQGPFSKYSNLNMAQANESLRGNRGGLFIVNGKLYNSQGGRMIPNRNELETDLFDWLHTNNKNNVEMFANDLRSTYIPRFTAKTYDGTYGNYKTYQYANKPSTLKLKESFLKRLFKK